MIEEIQEPKESREISSVKSTTGFANTYSNLLENTDSVLTNLGGKLSVYDEILRDPQVQTCFSQLREEIITAPYEIEPYSESQQDKAVADAVRDNLEHISFNSLTDKMLFAKFYGFAVSEVIWKIENGLFF